jgi:hypothetical protein
MTDPDKRLSVRSQITLLDQAAVALEDDHLGFTLARDFDPRQRWTGKQIAAEVGVSPATVSRVLRRLGEWAYARAYNTSDERTAELSRWLHRYNWHRPHGSIGSKPPISRLGLTGNNLLRLHS